VIAVLRTPARRITLAIALSVLIHAAIMWFPYFQWSHTKVEFPPLTVRLEPLPDPGEHPAENPQPEKPLTRSDTGSSDGREPGTMKEMEKTEQPASAHPFPKHLRLSFVVHSGKDGVMTGEIHHQLDIRSDRYTLRSVRKTAGLSSLRNSDQLVQSSHGKIVERGLQPLSFSEGKITKSGKLNMQATFDWGTQKLRFSNNSEIALPVDTQDMLSFMYQLSQIKMNGEFFQLPVSDAAQLQQYQIEVGTKEYIDTPMGKVRALHLRKMHARGEAYFDIWLGLEYRLLPVKFSQIDDSDKVIEEYVISSFRAADK
jgi:hypothetical protein